MAVKMTYLRFGKGSDEVDVSEEGLALYTQYVQEGKIISHTETQADDENEGDLCELVFATMEDYEAYTAAFAEMSVGTVPHVTIENIIVTEV